MTERCGCDQSKELERRVVELDGRRLILEDERAALIVSLHDAEARFRRAEDRRLAAVEQVEALERLLDAGLVWKRAARKFWRLSRAHKRLALTALRYRPGAPPLGHLVLEQQLRVTGADLERVRAENDRLRGAAWNTPPVHRGRKCGECRHFNGTPGYKGSLCGRDAGRFTGGAHWFAHTCGMFEASSRHVITSRLVRRHGLLMRREIVEEGGVYRSEERPVPDEDRKETPAPIEEDGPEYVWSDPPRSLPDETPKSDTEATAALEDFRQETAARERSNEQFAAEMQLGPERLSDEEWAKGCIAHFMIEHPLTS